MRNIVVVGAGMAGLACGRALSLAGRAVILVDKGRGPGGRMAARRLETPAGDAWFDLGTQAFTAIEPRFVGEVRQWGSAGHVAAWPAAGDQAWVGVPAMNAPLRAMAERLDIRWGTRVRNLAAGPAGWTIATDSGASFEADAVILAVPAEQAAELLEPVAADLAARARSCPSLPCWTVLLAFAEPLASARDTLEGDEAGPLGGAARNRARPGRTGPETWVVHGGGAWSARHLEDPAEWIEETLSAALSARLGIALPPTLARSSHRWRYANPAGSGSGPVWDPARGLGVCGDWSTGPGVEGAWLSGVGLADRMAAFPMPGAG